MKVVVFELADINKLIGEFEGNAPLYPTFDHLFDANLYKDGVVVDAKGRTKEKARAHGDGFFPDPSQMIKIPKTLVMKNDKGIYLTTNLKSDLTPIQRGATAFAIGCNPIKDDKFEANQKRILAEPTEFMVPISWVVKAMQSRESQLKLQVTNDSVIPVGQELKSA